MPGLSGLLCAKAFDLGLEACLVVTLLFAKNLEEMCVGGDGGRVAAVQALKVCLVLVLPPAGGPPSQIVQHLKKQHVSALANVLSASMFWFGGTNSTTEHMLGTVMLLGVRVTEALSVRPVCTMQTFFHG